MPRTTARPWAVKRVALLVVCGLLPVGALSAQAPPTEGDRVRITRHDGTVISGIFQATSLQGIVLRPVLGQEPPVIRFADVRAIDKNLGQYRRFWRNFGLAFGATVVVTSAAVALTWSPCTEFCSEFDRTRGGATLFYGGVLGSFFGVAIGTIVGTAVQYERWEPLSVPGLGPASITLLPSVGRRFQVAISVAPIR